MEVKQHEKPVVFDKKGYIVCLDTPINTEFGVDYKIFSTGEKFQGVKFLPLGLHFVVFGLKSNANLRQGYFVDLNTTNDVVVKQWNEELETFQHPTPAKYHIQRLQDAVRNFELDGTLAMYEQTQVKIWSKLSQFISHDVLKRCRITIGQVLVAENDDEEIDDVKADQLTPYFADLPATAKFTPLDEHMTEFDGPEQRTKFYFDRSEWLENIIEKKFDGKWQDLLGQWKILFWRLCSCEKTPSDRPQLYIEFVKLAKVHLLQVSEDFFHDVLSRENFIRSSLASLFEITQDDTLHPKFLQQVEKLKAFLNKRFNLELTLLGSYSFGDMDSAPAIVMPEDLPDDIFADKTVEEDLNAKIAYDILRKKPSST